MIASFNLRPKRRNHERWCRSRLRRLQCVARELGTLPETASPERLNRVLFRVYHLKQEIRLIEQHKFIP